VSLGSPLLSILANLDGSVILDGEMLAYSRELNRVLPFGTLKTAALGLFAMSVLFRPAELTECIQTSRLMPISLSAVSTLPTLLFYIDLTCVPVRVFDVLYLKGRDKDKGQSLIHFPLSERKRILQHIFKPLKGRFERVEYLTKQTSKDIQEALDTILDDWYVDLLLSSLVIA
jgi:hypothetical protein